MWRSAAVRGKMAVPGARLAAAGPGEEIQLATDGSTESVAVPLRATRTKSPSKALDRRRERRWIRAAQGGSDEALEQLYRHHWPWAYRAAYLVVHDAAAAEDIAQEAFLRRDQVARAVRSPTTLRAVVEPDRCQSRDRLGSGTIAAPRDGGRSGSGLAEVRSARPPRAQLRRLLRRHRGGSADTLSGSSARSSSFVISSSTRLVRSPTSLDLPRGTVNSRLRRGLDRLATDMQAR